MSPLASLLVLSLCHVVISKFTGWVDPDTHTAHLKRKNLKNGIDYDLVMSDEFEKEGRLFGDGEDPMWCALDRSDDDQTAQGKKSLQYYNSSMVSTRRGKLVIKTDTGDTLWRNYNPFEEAYTTMSRHFRSGMVQGWNKFCFTGGILEIRMKLPGSPTAGGLWPAAWLLGNLGRATYEASTNKMWPWSYDKCDRKLQQAQEISACGVTDHYDFNPQQGRGATEIDLMEAMPGDPAPLPIVKNNLHRPYVSYSSTCICIIS
jgi:beta-glucanase (GH16 family)